MTRRSRTGRPAARPRHAAAVLLAVLLAGCGAAAEVAGDDPPGATAACAAPEFPAVQAGLHLIGDREPPVPYSSSPPTSGWHRSGVGGPGVSTTPIPEPVQVGLLEEGFVVVTHGELATGDRRVLADLAAAHPDVVVVTPYEPLGPGQVVAAGWGVLQRCGEADAAALERFVTFYGGRGPETAHTTEDGR